MDAASSAGGAAKKAKKADKASVVKVETVAPMTLVSAAAPVPAPMDVSVVTTHQPTAEEMDAELDTLLETDSETEY